MSTSITPITDRSDRRLRRAVGEIGLCLNTLSLLMLQGIRDDNGATMGNCVAGLLRAAGMIAGHDTLSLEAQLEAANLRIESLTAIINAPKDEPDEVVVTDLFGDVEDFRIKFNQGYNGEPRHLDPAEAKFRFGFTVEEVVELHTGLEAGDAEVQFDSLLDLIYVAIGTIYRSGWDGKEGWRRVHHANMSKENASVANPGKRSFDLDIVKPAGWTAPDHSDLMPTTPGERMRLNLAHLLKKL